jgi:carbon monoxide dehydrogenase subunit G
MIWAAPGRACEPRLVSDRPRIERAEDGRGVRIGYRARLMAPLAAVDRLLSDPASLPQWFPGVSETRRTDEGFVAVYALPWPLGRVEEVMAVERRAHADGVSYKWHRLSGDFLRDDVCWRLRKIDRTTTEVTYFAELQLHHWVPVSLVRRAEKRALPKAAASLEAAAADLP